jgi:hypothetical protein
LVWYGLRIVREIFVGSNNPYLVLFQRGTGDRYKRVHRERLWMFRHAGVPRFNRGTGPILIKHVLGDFPDKTDPIFIFLSQTQNTTRTDTDPSFAHRVDGF